MSKGIWEIQRKWIEKEAIAQIIVGPVVSIAAPLGSAYMVGRGLMHAPYNLPLWASGMVALTMELTGFHVGGQLIAALDHNRRLSKRKEKKQGARARLLAVMLGSYIFGAAAFIAIQETVAAAFLPFLVLANVLTYNERVGQYWRETDKPDEPQGSSSVVSSTPKSKHKREREPSVAGHTLLRLRAQYPDATYETLGRLTAEAIGRGKPYSKAWVAGQFKKEGS